MRVFRVDYPEIVDQLIELFVESTPPLLSELRESAESGDGEAVHRSAHKLKGSCQNIGAGFMAKLAADLEVARAADPAQLDCARPGVRGHPRRPARSARGGRGMIALVRSPCLVPALVVAVVVAWAGHAARDVASRPSAASAGSPCTIRTSRSG